MRPYLVLCVVVLVSLAAFGQSIFPPPPRIGPCISGCGPFVPLITTPMVSFVTVSPNPVGASNATGGLYAGATNSTLSQIPTLTSSDYTEAVWYEGGSAPLTSSVIRLAPEPVSHAAHALPETISIRMDHPREEARAQWIYFSGTEHTADATSAAAAAKAGKKAAHSYTNADVERQNQNNGNVKYDGKTEKM